MIYQLDINMDIKKNRNNIMPNRYKINNNNNNNNNMR